MSGDSGNHRRRLVEQLEKLGAVRTTAVRDAFLAVRREVFVPEIAADRGLEAIYRNDPLVTKHDAKGRPISSSSEPQVMGVMLELLQCEPGQRILEIGAGTGYNAALLAELVGQGGRVVSVELDAGIAGEARRHLRDSGGGGAAVRVVCADGKQPVQKQRPFDRVIATASVKRIPIAWHDQLVPNGILVAPVGLQNSLARQVVAAFRRGPEDFRSERVVTGGFMALRSGESAEPPETLAVVHAGWNLDGDAWMAKVEGDVIRRMSEPARRRLASTLSEDPRRLNVRPRKAPSIAHLLALRPASVVQWSRRHEYLMGVASADGRSLAGVGRNTDGKTVAMEAGSDEASATLTRLIERADRFWSRGLDVVLVARRADDFTIDCQWGKPSAQGATSADR